MRQSERFLGNDFGIAVDFHGRVHKPMAKVLAHELEPYKLMFFEEVVLPENEESFQSIANQVSTPLATGERLITRWEYKRLFQQGAVDIIQPDVALCGGIFRNEKKSYQWQRRMIWQQHHMHHMVQSHLLRRYKWMFALQIVHGKFLKPEYIGRNLIICQMLFLNRKASVLYRSALPAFEITQAAISSLKDLCRNSYYLDIRHSS